MQNNGCRHTGVWRHKLSEAEPGRATAPLHAVTRNATHGHRCRTGRGDMRESWGECYVTGV